MNILFLINHAGKGGSEKYVYVLSEYLIKKGDSVFFIYNEEGPLVEKMKNLKIISEQHEMKSPFDFKAARYISDFSEIHKIDIIHTQFPRENYIALLVKKRLKNINVIYTSHIIVSDNIFRKILNKKFLSDNFAIISVCNKNKEVLIANNYPKEKIKVIFNGVPFKNYVHNVKNSTMRKDYSIPVDEFVFVTTSRFSVEKGMMFLLESAKFLTTLTKQNFKVMLVGDGEEYDKLENYVKENKELTDKIIFTGYINDVDSILTGSDCFVNSSKNEALSMSILEALGKALPIIATRVGGNSDIINDETNCGILVRYGSEIQMAQAMEKMMTNEKFYKICSENAINTIKQRFDLDKKCEEIYNIYLEAKEIKDND